MPLKLGAYVRVSTEEQASIVEGSLDNQKYRLKAFVDLKTTQVKNWGSIIEFYVDDGFSAKDTRRPAYQRMMNDVKKKKIDLILKLEGKRIIIEKNTKLTRISVDITPVWHFFKQVFISNPSLLTNQQKNEKDTRGII